MTFQPRDLTDPAVEEFVSRAMEHPMEFITDYYV